MSTANVSSLPPIELLVGKTLVKQKSLVATKDAMKGKELLLLYFSASWCPPCKTFSPILKEFYSVVKDIASLELIYVGSDRTLEEFDKFYSTMPWLAIGSEGVQIKKDLASKLQITGIPTVIVLDAKTGLFITNSARNEIQKSAGNVTKCNEVVAGWKSIEPVPLEEGIPLSQGLFSIKGMFMALLKNPMYIFGTLYMIKWLIRTFSNTDKGTVATIEDEPIPDDEF
jgi:nucleoredoxin